MNYSHTQQITINDFSDPHIESLYDQGFVFTRLGKGIMNQVRSLRVDLSKFSLTSENRRVLRKSETITCSLEPLPYAEYHWSIGKMAMDFYSEKFGEGVMSANKIKELFCEPQQSNMNAVFVYRLQNDVVSYCLVHTTQHILHYSYPFYDLEKAAQLQLHAVGMAMMTKAILWAQEQGKRYVYLGSAHDEKSLYKLQFEGLEWWSQRKSEWDTNMSDLKELVYH